MRKILVIVTLLCLYSPLLWADTKANKPFTVVIDAGHGGKDPGAVGQKAKEKTLNLNVALAAGRKIQKAYPEVRVLYTRTTDEFITLKGRSDFVNKNNADLFICIHANAVDNKAACGAETFVLGTEKMEQNLDVAMRENAVIKLESDYKTEYQGFDPNSIDSYIMFELMQNRYMDQSVRFAELVQQQLVDSLHRMDRGVRQAAFWVLLKSACPSVLIEMGFVSNPDEERYMSSEEGQDEIASGIFRAFSAFYRKPSSLPLPQPEKSAVAKSVAEKSVSKSKASSSQSVKAAGTVASPAVVAPKKDEPVIAEPAPQPVRYAVQITARRQPLAEDDPALQGLRCGCLQQNGWYKYYYGCFEDREAARQMMIDLRTQFPDCFIIKL